MSFGACDNKYNFYYDNLYVMNFYINIQFSVLMIYTDERFYICYAYAS